MSTEAGELTASVPFPRGITACSGISGGVRGAEGTGGEGGSIRDNRGSTATGAASRPAKSDDTEGNVTTSEGSNGGSGFPILARSTALDRLGDVAIRAASTGFGFDRY